MKKSEKVDLKEKKRCGHALKNVKQTRGITLVALVITRIKQVA